MKIIKTFEDFNFDKFNPEDQDTQFDYPSFTANTLPGDGYTTEEEEEEEEEKEDQEMSCKPCISSFDDFEKGEKDWNDNNSTNPWQGHFESKKKMTKKEIAAVAPPHDKITQRDIIEMRKKGGKNKEKDKKDSEKKPKFGSEEWHKKYGKKK